MLRAAKRSRRELGEAAERVLRYTRDHLHPEGGFRDRSGSADLYYSVFGLQTLGALDAEPDAEYWLPYLNSFGAGESLDLVHLASLARAWAFMPQGSCDAGRAEAMARAIEGYRSADGAYGMTAKAPLGNVYACFLALGAYQDLKFALPSPASILNVLPRLRARDGGYANQPGMEYGLTPSTAAAAILMTQLQAPAPQQVGEWLLSRCHTGGGFFASPQAPLPDLLSTATALHALAELQVPLTSLRETCIDFLDTLWTSRGGFCGSWVEATPDCEYTYYGLLALGHLSP